MLDSSLFYKITKQKKPFLLFFPVLGLNHTSLLNISNFYQKQGYSTILFDYPKHSDDLSIKDWSVWCKQIKDMLIKERIKGVYVVSSCSGSCIALMFYQLYPEFIKKMIFINFFSPKYINGRWDMVYHLGYPIYYLLKFVQILGIKMKKRERYIDYSKVKIPTPTLKVVKNCLKSMNTISYLSLWGKARTYSPSIKEILIPSLIVIPENEKFSNPQLLFKDAKKNKFLNITVLKSAHHGYNKCQIKEICENTLSFLAK